jgi:hypothetical protein
VAAAFTAWYSMRYGGTLDWRVTEHLASLWLQGCMPGTEHAVSPDRTLEFVMAIGDLVHDEDERDELLDLVPEWVQWIGELGGIPELIDLAVSAA